MNEPVGITEFIDYACNCDECQDKTDTLIMPIARELFTALGAMPMLIIPPEKHESTRLYILGMETWSRWRKSRWI